MQLRTETLGHVSIIGTATPAMEVAEEANETLMFRSRYAHRPYQNSHLLRGFMPHTQEIIYNPATLLALAEIFQTNIEVAFAA